MKKLFAICCVILLAACSDAPNVPFTEGEHYRELSYGNPSANKQVVLYISLTCPHCYTFSEVFDEYVKANADSDVQIERIPVLFNQPSWLGFVRLYAAMRQLGVHDELILPAFEAIQTAKLPLHVKDVAINWLVEQGQLRPKVLAIYNSPTTDATMDMYSQSESVYKIKAIPTLIVNGKYYVETKSLSGETDEERLAELTKLIDFLHQKAFPV